MLVGHRHILAERRSPVTTWTFDQDHNRPMSRRLPHFVFNALRRQLLLLGGLAPTLGLAAKASGTGDAPDAQRRVPSFPRDHGSHPDTRIEWWYITGHARVGDGDPQRICGFQLTFFRARVDATQQMASKFAARQLLFAHAALSDTTGKRFLHDQRIAREGFGVAQASSQDMDVRLRDWTLRRHNGRYEARILADGFALALDFSATTPVLLQGDQGWSRKGPDPAQASTYYSHPQLAFEGHITLGGQRTAVAGAGARGVDSAQFAPVDGAAWLDHEWSDSLLGADAVGWDWIGINLFDGSALTAFRIRDKNGQALWDGGSFRHPKLNDGIRPYVCSQGETLFQPVRGWKSPRTQATYPVEWLLRTPAEHYVLRALLDDQELDSRSSTGAIYWEGLCDLFDSQRRHLGRGYLEMTGYARPLVL
jgi:predicted secreted hydrolase